MLTARPRWLELGLLVGYLLQAARHRRAGRGVRALRRARRSGAWAKRWQKSTTASTKALAAGDSDRLLSSQTQNTSGSFINSFTGTMETVPALTSLSTANRGSKAHLRSKLTSALTRVIELVTQNTFGLIAWRLNVRSICCRTPEDLSVRTKGNSASSCNDMALRPASG